ncbi:MAG TPA: EAL domain-containing protein [Solirubrobacteraceae bacterium]|nr:EAL domain-containing protein [Solirubrobacteraceae bacterium]
MSEPVPTSPSAAGEDGYRQLLERVPAVVYIAEPGEHGRWLYVSAQIEAILGFTPGEWYADRELWFKRLHEGDRAEVLEREHTDEAGFTELTATEYRMLHRDGRTVWIRDEAQLIRGDSGRPLWHGVLLDITDRKLVEEELERRAAQQAAVAMVGERALEGRSTDELVEESVAAAARLLDADLAVMIEHVPEHEHFRVRASHGDIAAEGARMQATPESQPGYAMHARAPVVVEDWATEERFLAPPPELGLRSGVCVLIEGSRGTFGVLSVQCRRTRVYRSDEIDFLQSLANVLADALERQAIEDDIRHRALHDELTGLPNRVLFLDRIEQALARLRRNRSLAAILFLDFDHFKVINDSLGHHVGDELLAAAAPRLKHAVRASDTVARFGGDEFAILLEDIGGESDAIEMAERVASLFARPFLVAGSEHFVSASVGIALARGGELPMELIRDADAAMYRAKERGRSRYEVFDEAMRGRALARLRVENDLRRALERSELRLDYQPVVSLRDRAIVGVEALIRWHHPQRGLVSPAEFIPVAEENGLIEPIGRWVLERACRQAAHWHAAHPDARPIEMSVNLSVVQLRKPGLTDTVAAALQASGLDPATLSLEITETAMAHEAEGIVAVLESLGALGVRLVLDDFGTGYSSLSYLPRLPLDALKVDRSFVDGLGVEPHDTAITEAIIALARALSLGVVAEGVEGEGQIGELRRLGCELAQGFHFSRPVPAGEISAMLHDGPRWPMRS